MAGDDGLYGRGGRDGLVGGTEKDYLYAGPGADALLLGGADDTARGGGRGDEFFASPGQDRIFGGRGPDLVLARDDGEPDAIACGRGDDSVHYRGSQTNDPFDVLSGCEEVVLGPSSEVSTNAYGQAAKHVRALARR
jgi:hypothetical protein